MSETRIKICGLRREEDIRAVNRCRPDYAGFICAPPFWRYIEKEKAARLRELLDPAIPAVGVFVDQPVETILGYLQEDIVQVVQLHGHEEESYLRQLREGAEAIGKRPLLIQAFQVKDRQDVGRALQSSADLILLDGGSGSGQAFDWSLLGETSRPWLLAGGLTPDNLEEAIERLHPYGVDISSGVETDRVKDPEKIAACTAIAKRHRGGA